MLQIKNNQTMSSREIAELTKKEHRNIVPVIEQLIDGGVLKNSTPNYYIHPQNKQQYLEYFADKRDSLIIVARLSPEFTAAVIDRWQELESKSNLTVFNHDTSTHRGALLALVASLDKIEADKPKVQAFDTLIGADTIFSMNQTAKLLGWGRNKLFAELRNRSILMNNNLPYQAQIDNGRFVVKDTPIQRSIGTMVVSQSYVTTKGQVWLSKLLGDTK